VTEANGVLERAEAILGHRFKDRELLSIALTHASVAESRLVSNERLEFLGDAVLGMLTCDYLYDKFPGLLEGDLTKIKSLVVSRKLCAKIASELGLDTLLILGKGMKTRAALPASLSAAVLESVLGALYLDAGLDKVRAFLMPRLTPHIEQAARSGHQQNFKSVLQHYAQQHLSAQPVYVLLDEKGPDHEKCFEVCVEVGSRRYRPCWAASKKQAEQQAALAALEDLGLIARDERGELIFAPQQQSAEAQKSAQGEAAA